MKRFTTIALVALLALAALVVPATAQMDVIEVRSQVYNETDLASDIEITATEFAGFWYDLDEGDSSESITINSSFVSDNRSIAEDGLEYNASIVQTGYEADFEAEAGTENNDTYPVIGFFAEKYVSLDDTSPDELVKLLLDNDDKYTLRTGSALELPNGYELTAKQIDVEGDKVWMELSKDGEFVEDEVINVVDGEATWTYDVDVGDTDDVIVFRALITDVFQGQVDSLAVVEGLYLVDYEDILEIESGDEFGELEVDSTGSGTIIMKNTGTVTLSRDDTVDIAEGMMFKVADDSETRFYLMKEYTEPGTYEIRGSVAVGEEIWTPANFAGFFYDLDDAIGTEELSVTGVSTSDRSIEEDALTYNTSIEPVDYTADFGDDTDYPVVGFFAEKYVSLDDDSADELVKLLLDNDDKYTLRTGSALELPNGYELTAKQIDVEGDKVWMELSKDGEFIEDEVISMPTNGSAATWTFEEDVGDTDDVPVFKALVTDVFQGQVDSLAVVEGLYLIEYQDVLDVESGDEFGELEVDSVSGDTISMSNTGTITLGVGDTVDIAENMKFEVADDNSQLRYYPFVELTIEGEETTQPDEEEEMDEEEQVTDNETEGNDTIETPVDETPDETEEPPVEDEGNETTDEQPAPGFEAVFAVAGLLAVAYLVRRN